MKFGLEGKHVLITGGVHGDEFEPMAAIRQLPDLLQLQPHCGRVTLVPVVNESAFRRGNRVGDGNAPVPLRGNEPHTGQGATCIGREMQHGRCHLVRANHLAAFDGPVIRHR